MADEDDVSDVKPLTIWQQKAVREAHGLELEKVDIENDIVQIQAQIDALEPQVNVIKDELWGTRKKMGSYATWVTRGDDIRQLSERPLGASDAPAVSQRRIRQECELLTKRKQFVLSKNDKAVGFNNEIKREIDLARREKIVFERVSQRMIDDLADTAHELKQLNYEIENLYADRDAAQLRMQDLKKMYDQDKHQFLKDYEDLTVIIDRTDIAIQKLQRQKLHRRSSTTRMHGKALSPVNKGRKNSSSSLASLSDMAYERKLKELEHVEEQFAALSGAVGLEFNGNGKEIYQAVTTSFDTMSKDEFNLINKVNEVTLEYEEALKTVQILNNEFKSIMEENESRNAERAEVLSQSQKENIKSEQSYLNGKHMHEEALQNLETLFEPLHTTFFKIGCDKFITGKDASQIEFLQSNPEAITVSDPTTEVKSDNYMLFLGILESRGKNLVHQYSALISERKRQNKAAHRRSVLPKMPDMGPAKAHGSLSKFTNIVAPSLKDNDNLNDDDILAATNGNLSLTQSIRSYQMKLAETLNASKQSLN